MKKKSLIIIIITLIILIVVLSFYLYQRFFLPVNITNSNHNIDQWLYNSNVEIDSISSGFNSSSISSKSFGFESVDVGTVLSSASDYSSAGGTLGFSTGGAKNIENFRENIKNGYFPISTDITYNGLFYDYSFDTGNSKGNSDELFYPSYSTAISKDIFSEKNEYYISVGLNSNIKESDFVRPKLNLVVVLDNSGSMSSSFDSYYYDSFLDYNENKSKMEIANNSVNILLDELNDDDRFSLVIFNSTAQIATYLNKKGDTDINSLKNHILEITATGGTNFEAGYQSALNVFDNLGTIEDGYQNRIIVITDAMPNMGTTYSNSLSKMIENSSKKGIYTTFLGVGVDFNTELIEKLGTVEGANYYSVHNEEEFESQMGDEFDFMVTPLVFDLNLDFKSQGYKLEAVYGTDVENNKKGNIMHVNTLFPSKSNSSGEIKGGIILLKLNKTTILKDGKITLQVSYRDKNNVYHKNTQEVTFENTDSEYYDNTGIRKGILLTRYANLLKDWIIFERSNENKNFLVTPKTGIIYPDYTEDQITKILGEHERTSVTLTVSSEYNHLFNEMKSYIESEMKELDDKDLEQEITILDKLISTSTSSNPLWNNIFD